MAGHIILFSVLHLSLLSYSVSGQVFWSVNCGASDYYIDDNTISWTPDSTLISNGLTRVVQSSNSVSTVLDSLRVFTSRKKNCYSTAVTKGEKVLVRASFNYGNYDRLSSPPSFDLHFDGNFWATVETSNTRVKVYEATYVTKGADVSVCVAQTNTGQFPFMSTLEVRSIDPEVYDVVDQSRALFLLSRVSFGASATLRFPQDPYDRIWKPPVGGTAEVVTSDAIFINSTGTNNPPLGILENAVTTQNTSQILDLGLVSPSDTPLYITTYFSEVSDLDSTQTRSFRFYEITASESSPISPPISPPYGAVIGRYLNNYTVTIDTNISLFATPDSDLPPIINALEAFNISGVLTDGTDNNDVAVLISLQNTFDVLGEWSGDPCLPAPYSWDWLNCSNDSPPRVTSLYLDGFELSGELPDISSMDALEIIDLHNNSFTGGIPSYLGTMANLQQLNLADNDFSGSIPTSLSKNNKLKLNITGNPSLCTSGKSCSSSPGTVSSSPGTTNKKKKSSTLPVILGITIPIFFLIWVAAGIFIICRKKNKPAKANMPVATGHTGGATNGPSGGGANGTSHEMHKIGNEMMNEIVDNVVQQTFGSPSPLLDNSDQSSDLYGRGVQNNDHA